jgi:hypothetical protein
MTHGVTLTQQAIGLDPFRANKQPTIITTTNVTSNALPLFPFS